MNNNQLEMACKRIFDNDLQFYKSVVEELKIPVLVVNDIGIVIYGNRATCLLTGYKYAELPLLRFVDLVPMPNNADLFQILETRTLEYRAKLKHKEGALIPITIKAYNFTKHEKRKFHYQVILKNFYIAPDELSSLYKPLEQLATQIKKANNDLEKQLKFAVTGIST